MSMVKRVTTCIDADLWREAHLNDISWAKALETGIKVHLGGEKEETELLQERKELEGKIRFIDKHLAKLKKKTTEEKEKMLKITDTESMKYIKKTIPILKTNIGALKARTRVFNTLSGLDLTPDDFYKLVKRVETGGLEHENTGKRLPKRTPVRADIKQ